MDNVGPASNNLHNTHPSVSQIVRGKMEPAHMRIEAFEHQNEEPFRVVAGNVALYRNKTLTQVSDEMPIESLSIVSAKYVNNSVVFIGDPYNCYVSSKDVEPLDLKHPGFQGGIADIIDEDAENEYDSPEMKNNGNNYVNNNNNGGGHAKSVYSETVLVKPGPSELSSNPTDDMMSDQLSAATGDFDRPPQSFAAPKPQDFVNPNARPPPRNGLSPIPSQQGNNMANGGSASPHGSHRSMASDRYNQAPQQAGGGQVPVNARHAIHGLSYKDQNGLEQHIGLNQDLMLSSVLGPGPAQHQQQYSQASHNSQFRDVKMGRRRSDSNGSHVSSHSRTSQHSHRSHRSAHSHHSQQHTAQAFEDDIDDGQGSVYSMDYEPSVDTFVPLPRKAVADDKGVKMSYVKGGVDGSGYHSITKSQLKSPLMFNQIANDIQIKRSKSQKGTKKIKDNIIITKFGDGRPLLDRNYFSQSKGVRGGLVVVIPFFNEPAVELEATLRYLYATYSWMCETDPAWATRPMDICMIQDGWYKASESMQRYLKKLYPKQYFIDPGTGKQTIIGGDDDDDAVNKPKHGNDSMTDMVVDGNDNSDDDDFGGAGARGHEDDGKNMYDTPTGAPNGSAVGSRRGGKHAVSPSGLSGISSVSRPGQANKAKSEASYAATTLPEISKYWWEFLPEFMDYNKQRDGSVTYVFEKTHDNPCYFELKFKPDENGKIDKRMEAQRTFRITLIVKIDNRRKHNSHEWFLGENGFSDAYHARYLFATDAFTLFELPCMYHMVHYLDTHPDTAAVTGRQRAMNRRQQGKHGKEFALSIAYMLRMTQTFDFELTSGVFNPVYGVVGFLPVIPGPCGLYRCGDVSQNKARYWYFDIVNAEPTETGLILGNLRIAEDRILTYAAILKVKDYRRMAFVPAGLFFFETETDLGSFIFQRRRWINGTFAGFIYILISAPYHVWGWHANFWVKFKVWLLLVINFAQLSTVVLSPAISFSILGTSLSFLLDKLTDEGLSLSDNIMLFGWILWCLHVIIHNTAKFSHVIIKLLYGWSFLISSSLIVTYFLLFVVEGKDVYEGLLVPGMKAAELDFILGLMAFGTVVPFSCAYMVGGWEGVWILAQSVVQYFLSFHLMIPWFTSYAFARCWDLTWGNRPAEGEMDEVEAEKFEAAEIMKAKFLQYSRLVALALIVSNLGLYLIPKYYIILTMSGFLMATAFFMGSSFVVLISQTFCGECMVNILSRSLEEYRKAEERERQEMQLYGGVMESNGKNLDDTGGQNEDGYSDSDEEYVVIPQEYQVQPTTPSRHLGQYTMDDNADKYNGDEYENGYYDDNGAWVDYDAKNATHNNFDQRTEYGNNEDANSRYMPASTYNGGNDDQGQGNDDPDDGFYDDDGAWIANDPANDNNGGGGAYDENGVWVDDPSGGVGFGYNGGNDAGYTQANNGGNDDGTGGGGDAADGFDVQYDATGDTGAFDEAGGYYDEAGNYFDASGGYYDEAGQYIEAAQNYDEANYDDGAYYEP